MRSSRIRLLLLLGLVLGVGLWFRLWAIDTLPPQSLSRDEAYYGVDALRILHGEWLVYSTENTGREAFYMLIAAGIFKVFGVSVLVFRIYNAVLSILTLLAVFWLGYEAAADRQRAPWVGLLSMASLAVLLMHVILSRNTLRPNLMPLVTTLTFATLLRAFRTRGWKWYFLAGALLGLVGHTYVTARATPLVVLAAFALWFGAERRQLRQYGLKFLVVVGMALLVYSPLAIFFLQNPGWFLHRAQALFTPATLLQSSWSSLIMFHFKGDHIFPSNLPYRPIFDVAQTVVSALGVGLALSGRLKRPGYLLLIWFFIGWLPAALSNDAPSYMHSYSMLPPLAILMGHGYLGLADFIKKQAQQPPRLQPVAPALAAGVVTLALCYSTGQTAYDFFVRWASYKQHLNNAFMVHQTAMGKQLRALPANPAAFITPGTFIEPTLAFALENDTSRVHPYDGRACMVVGSASQQPLIYFINPGDTDSLGWLSQFYPQGQATPAEFFTTYQVAAGQQPAALWSSSDYAAWGQAITLTHAAAEVINTAPQQIKLTLAWRPGSLTSPATFIRFVHLLSADATQPGGVRLWAQTDASICHDSHPPRYWQPGETIVETLTLTPTEPLPPQTYRLALGIYWLDNQERWPVTESTWPAADNLVTLATLALTP